MHLLAGWSWLAFKKSIKPVVLEFEEVLNSWFRITRPNFGPDLYFLYPHHSTSALCKDMAGLGLDNSSPRKHSSP